MGRVLVEAMACGKPIVGSDAGGIPDLLKHNRNGLLVPPGDSGKLAAAIVKILEEPEKAARMGKNGMQFCKKFTNEAMLDKIDRLYRRVVQENAGSKVLEARD